MPGSCRRWSRAAGRSSTECRTTCSSVNPRESAEPGGVVVDGDPPAAGGGLQGVRSGERLGPVRGVGDDDAAARRPGEVEAGVPERRPDALSAPVGVHADVDDGQVRVSPPAAGRPWPARRRTRVRVLPRRAGRRAGAPCGEARSASRAWWGRPGRSRSSRGSRGRRRPRPDRPLDRPGVGVVRVSGDVHEVDHQSASRAVPAAGNVNASSRPRQDTPRCGRARRSRPRSAKKSRTSTDRESALHDGHQRAARPAPRTSSRCAWSWSCRPGRCRRTR